MHLGNSSFPHFVQPNSASSFYACIFSATCFLSALNKVQTWRVTWSVIVSIYFLPVWLAKGSGSYRSMFTLSS
ncbi:hypothetical protein BJ878DRAFT_179678, partial [Calycina marina]